jgi:nitrogen regulatory protein PII
MKRIELIIEPSALDRFAEAARMMNLSDLEVTEVRRFPLKNDEYRQRVYRGQTFLTDFEERLKVDINADDGAANHIAAELIARINPEKVAILRLDQATIIDGPLPIHDGSISSDASFRGPGAAILNLGESSARCQ